MAHRRHARTILMSLSMCQIASLSACDIFHFQIPDPDSPITNLVIFGDSLSDVGNVHAMTGGIVPLPPYFNGRFSNGDIWADHVARHFGLPMIPSQRGGLNFAVGGATTEREGTVDLPFDAPVNLRQQVADYLMRYVPDPVDVFIIWNGGNDIFDMIRGSDDLTPQASADNVLLAILVLYDAGARRFAVVNAPDVDLIPRYRNSSNTATVTRLVDDFNEALDLRLDIAKEFRDIVIYEVEARGMLRGLIDEPPVGVTETSMPAWSGSFGGFLTGGELSDFPDQHLFFDRVHPTRITHAAIADRMIQAITELLEMSNGETMGLR